MPLAVPTRHQEGNHMLHKNQKELITLGMET